MLHFFPHPSSLAPTPISNIFFKKNVGNVLNISYQFGIIKIAGSLPLPNWGEVADSGAPHVLVSADTRKIPIFVNKSIVFEHFGAQMTNKAPFCVFLFLTTTVLSQLLKKAVLMALWTMAGVCDKVHFTSKSCRELSAVALAKAEHKAGKVKIGVNRRNTRLINDLRLRKITYEKIKLFMQNEPNFRKSQVNVSDLLTREYVKMDTWSIRKKQSQNDPNFSQ